MSKSKEVPADRRIEDYNEDVDIIHKQYTQYRQLIGQLRSVSIFPNNSTPASAENICKNMAQCATTILALSAELESKLEDETDVDILKQINANRMVVDDIRSIIIVSEQNQARL